MLIARAVDGGCSSLLLPAAFPQVGVRLWEQHQIVPKCAQNPGSVRHLQLPTHLLQGLVFTSGSGLKSLLTHILLGKRKPQNKPINELFVLPCSLWTGLGVMKTTWTMTDQVRWRENF